MRSFISFLSILVVALISLGACYYFLKRAAPAPGTIATQEITTTGVEMDLNAIAQAERMYYVQNGNYANMDQLASGGVMNINRSGRDGYSYDVETSGNGFTVTARHPETPLPPGTVGGAVPLHYPALSVDESMQVRRAD